MQERQERTGSLFLWIAACALCVAAPSALAQQASAPEQGGGAEAAALALQLMGRYHEASLAYEALLARPKTAVDAGRLRYALATCREGLFDHDRAVAEFLRVASDNPLSDFADDALLAAGRIHHYRFGQPEKARELYAQLRLEYPESPLKRAALLEIGRAFERSLKLDEAVEAYGRVPAEAGHAPGGEPSALARLATERKRFLLDNADNEYRPMKMYLRAEWLARGRATQRDALRELIRLAALYPGSSLADDAFALMIRICLVRGDIPGARDALERLLQSGPGALSAEPVRSCAVSIAEWMLQDADRQIASEADLFPELAGYKPGENIRLIRGTQTDDVVLSFNFHGGQDNQRHLKFTVKVRRADSAASAAFPMLNLDVETAIDTSSDMLERELHRVLKQMTDTLQALNDAVRDGGAGPLGVARPAAGRSADAQPGNQTPP